MNYGFNNYGGYGWQEPRQSYMSPTQMSGTSQPANNEERIWVNGEAQARDYLMAPNSFVRLWDSTGARFYEKRTDASGRPYLEVFEYSRKGGNSPAGMNSGGVDYEARLKGIEARLKALEGGTQNEQPTTDCESV